MPDQNTYSLAANAAGGSAPVSPQERIETLDLHLAGSGARAAVWELGAILVTADAGVTHSSGPLLVPCFARSALRAAEFGR